MKKNRQQLFTLYLALFFVQSSFGQTLWPGDINDNGIVNGIDVLYAGIAYGSNGFIRPSGSETWQAQTIGGLWTQSFFDGTNYAYADCDGNGVIDEDDISETIENNFSLTHGVVTTDEYSDNNSGDAPAVKLLPQNTNIGVGATAFFDLWLGDEVSQVQDFYGIALVLTYNPDFILGSEWEYEEAENAWYDPTDDESEDLLVVDEVNGKMELAITRLNQQSISGSGKLGEFSIVIEDIIVGLQADTLNLEIEAIRMIDENFNTLPVILDNATVVVSRPNDINPIDINKLVHIFPNPTKDVFTISSAAEIHGYELRDISGKKIISKNIPPNENNTTEISLSSLRLTPQLYLLKIFTSSGIVVKKILLSK